MTNIIEGSNIAGRMYTNHRLALSDRKGALNPPGLSYL